MTIVEIEVTLEDVEPQVSQTLQVPADIRLDRLHLTLRAAVGWSNSHLYLFEAGQVTWGVPDPDFGNEDLPASKHTLWDVVEDTGRRTIHYIYDFGDHWEHKIKIGNCTDPAPGELYPRLLKVTGRCPPEDRRKTPLAAAIRNALTRLKRLRPWLEHGGRPASAPLTLQRSVRFAAIWSTDVIFWASSVLQA